MTTFTIERSGGGIDLIPDDREALADATDFADALTCDTGAPGCNGWMLLDPCAIGALTDGEILSDEVEFDPITGEIMTVGRVYWNCRYECEDVMERLRNGETVHWPGFD
jgi:hypothetical protein